MNVPEPFLKRHPFPGPGLAVRVLGDVTQGNALDILRQVFSFYPWMDLALLVYLLIFILLWTYFFPGWWDFHSVNQGCWALRFNMASFCCVFASKISWSSRWSENTFSCCCSESCYKSRWNDSRLVSLYLFFICSAAIIYFLPTLPV